MSGIALPQAEAQARQRDMAIQNLVMQLHIQVSHDCLAAMVARDALDKGIDIEKKVDKAMLFADTLLAKYGMKLQRSEVESQPAPTSNIIT